MADLHAKALGHLIDCQQRLDMPAGGAHSSIPTLRLRFGSSSLASCWASLRRSAVDEVEGSVVDGVVAAGVVVFGVGCHDVELVALAASAHGGVAEFLVERVVAEHEGAVAGGALGFVDGEGVAVVEVAARDVVGGDDDGWSAVEDNGCACVVGVGDDAEVAVVDADAAVVAPGEHPVAFAQFEAGNSRLGGRVEIAGCLQFVSGALR